MSGTGSSPAGHHGADGGGHPHARGSVWRTHVFSTDHKVIGIQYGLTSLVFMLLGFFLMLAMRWQLAYPGQPLPLIGRFFSPQNPFLPGGAMSPDLYNSFGAMHGTIMIFLGVVPLAFGAFGNYVVPLQIGAPDMAFPRINMASYHAYFWGGVLMLASFLVPGGAAKSGWTSYAPLASVADTPALAPSTAFHPVFNGQTMWLIAMVLLITSSLLGAVNFITTIIQLRAKGMSWMRLPFFVWAQLVTAFLLLLAFPPLEAAGIMQLMDRLAGTSFFVPSGLYVGGKLLEASGGGSPILWQHLFWFLGHPEVYVLILPAMGIVSEVIAVNSRKPIWGYRPLVLAAIAIGFLSFMVWAHHMYLTGMGSKVSTFFQTTTVLISVPSVIILTALLISLWGGAIRFTTPMLFAAAFIPMFGLGGLTGLPLAFNAIDLALHDTYYVIGHFHYVVAPGTIFALFAGIYHWYPKITGRRMSEFWGRVHFWPSLVCMNGIFLPMFLQGMAGVHRRWYDGGGTIASPTYELVKGAIHWNEFMSISAFLLAAAQVPFIINLFVSLWRGERVGDNPWEATTLEWAAPTPPPHGNFALPVEAHRGPYEYSVPGHERDFLPQWEAAKGSGT